MTGYTMDTDINLSVSIPFNKHKSNNLSIWTEVIFERKVSIPFNKHKSNNLKIKSRDTKMESKFQFLSTNTSLITSGGTNGWAELKIVSIPFNKHKSNNKSSSFDDAIEKMFQFLSTNTSLITLMLINMGVGLLSFNSFQQTQV